jgi:hypothetical protein
MLQSARRHGRGQAEKLESVLPPRDRGQSSVVPLIVSGSDGIFQG